MIDFDESKWILNPEDFEENKKKSPIKGAILYCSFFTQKTTGRKCAQKELVDPLKEPNSKRRFDRIISIRSTNSHPAIVPFVGFYVKGDYGCIIEDDIEIDVKSKLNKIKKGIKSPIWDETHKLIIVYGISCAMEFLHNKQIIHRSISTLNVLLNSELHPFLSGFCSCKKIDSANPTEFFNGSAVIITAPELINDPETYGESFPIDVYSFGITVYEIVTEIDPYPISTAFKVWNKVSEGGRPIIPSNITSNWKELIQACWNQQPEKRPTFTEICDVLESYVFVNDRIDRTVFENYKKLVKPFRPSSQRAQKIIDLEKIIEDQSNQIQDLKNKLKPQMPTFNPFEEEMTNLSKDDENIFIDSDDLKFYKTIKKIGEGATSIVYKIIDTRTEQILCKKVLKICDETSSFRNMKNAMKEFDVLHKINHPCICKAIKINTSEPIKNETEDQEQEEEMTTISLYLEFISRSLKEMIDQKVLDNTLKVKIVVEIVHALNFIHKNGMIHRDIKIENIMLNSAFETKIVDFGLIRIDECLNGQEFVASSLTKGVGTLAYMYPEMVNEEDYDNKTDVYSFGIVLHYIFLGKLPNYNMKDKMLGKPITLPNPSSMISQFGINLISKCTANKPVNRPSFDQILKEIRDQSYLIAPEIDRSLISKRDRELSFFESFKNQ